MIIFRRNYLKSSSFVIDMIPIVAMGYILIKDIKILSFWNWEKTEALVAIMTIVFFICPGIYSLFQQLYYIEIHTCHLVLRNACVKPVRKIFPFNGKKEILIAYNRASALNYIKFRRKGQKRWGWYYGIDLVDPKDLKEIISILESKGVTVITKDLRADV